MVQLKNGCINVHLIKHFVHILCIIVEKFLYLHAGLSLRGCLHVTKLELL